jgi:serine/threonine protein kinase
MFVAMRNEEWQKVEELLDAALELAPAERQRFLDEAGASLELKDEVQSLLACEEQTNGFLAAPALALSADFFAGDGDERAGQTVGHYQIVREIGRGGMGTVYLGQRSDDEYRKFVAIKVVRRGMDTHDILRRFRNERQILASLEHPYIARLLDGGTTDDGLPYLVMEHVEGLPITDYCDQRRLTTEERLELFRMVCAAVQHAHQNLVVHRDLKPSNILITSDGTPKLLDFGISKVLDPELSAFSMEHTRTEFRVLTPDYASPEQVRGEQVTTASDIYSLGIVLYELLAGHRPYRATAAPAHELVRIICEQEPTRPSTAIINVEVVNHDQPKPQITITPESVSRARDTQPDKLRRRLSGDLDNIVLMALRKEPKRRYESAAQFAADIGRHLEGLPVSARKDTVKYRATKFVRRNRLGVLAAALVLISLVAGLAAALWQAGVARGKARIAAENQTKADQSRIRAERETEKSRKILAFMERVLSYANPAWYAEGSQTRGQARLIDVLNEMGAKIEAEFPDDLDVQAELHHKCAEIFLANRMFDRAAVHARRALELRRQVFGERHPEVAKDLYYLGAFTAAQGKSLEHNKLLRQAAAIFREVAPDNPNLPYLLEDLGSMEAMVFGNPGEAEKLLTESLELFRRKDGDAHRNTVRLYFDLSVNAARKGDNTRADELFREGERRIGNLPGADAQLEISLTRGLLESAKGDSAAAETTLKQLIVEARKLKGEESTVEQSARRGLVEIYQREKDWAKAAEVQRAKVEAARKAVHETSFGLVMELAPLSVYLLRAGRRAEAKPVFEEAYRIFRDNDGDDEALLYAKIFIGESLMLLGRRDEALPLIEAAYEFSKTNLPATHRERIHAEVLLAETHRRRP